MFRVSLLDASQIESLLNSSVIIVDKEFKLFMNKPANIYIKFTNHVVSLVSTLVFNRYLSVNDRVVTGQQ